MVAWPKSLRLPTLREVTRIVAAGSVLFSGLGIGLLVFGVPPSNPFHLLPGVNIEISTMVLVPFSFLFVFQTRYPEDAVWLLGLFWGINELTWQLWATIFIPYYEVGSLALEGWPFYMFFVGIFFSLSVFRMRKRFKAGALGFIGLLAVGFLPVLILADLNVQVLPFLGQDTARDALIVGALALCVKVLDRTKPVSEVLPN